MHPLLHAIVLTATCFFVLAGTAYPAAGPMPGPDVGDLLILPMLSGGMTGVAVEADGLTVLIAEGSGELSRVDLVTGTVETIAFLGVGGARSPVIEAGGTTALVISPTLAGFGSGLKRVNLETGEVTTVVANGIDEGTALAIEPGRRTALVTGFRGGLFRANLETGVVGLVSAVGGLGIAIEPGGATALIAPGFQGAVNDCDLLRVDLTTGAATTVACIFATPAGVAIEPGGATALVTTSRRFAGETARIFRVDLTSGVATLLGECPFCTFPQITIEPSGNTALFLGEGGGAILVRLDRSAFAQTVLAESVSPLDMAIGPDGTEVFAISPGYRSLPVGSRG